MNSLISCVLVFFGCLFSISGAASASMVDDMLAASIKGDANRILSIKSNLEKNPRNTHGDRKEARVLNAKGLSALGQHDFIVAADFLTQAFAADVSDAEIASNLGFALLKIKKIAEAKEIIVRSIRLDPARSAAWINLGEAFAHEGDVTKAAAAFNIAFLFAQDKNKIFQFLEQLEIDSDFDTLKVAAKFSAGAKGISPVIFIETNDARALAVSKVDNVVVITGADPSRYLDSDKRSWVNVVRLRDAVKRTSAMPSGDYGCNEEGDGEEEPTFHSLKERAAYKKKKEQESNEMNRQLVKCEADRARQEKVFNLYKDAFNKKWIPILEKAMQAGDPVAEVVLRLCDTAPILDRNGIASDCSDNAKDREFAKARLELINFRPALHKYANTKFGDKGFECNAADPIAKERCNSMAEIARYKRILDVMRSGYLDAAEPLITCRMNFANEELDRLEDECLRQFYVTRVVAQRAEYGYAGNLALVHGNEFPGGESSFSFDARLDWPSIKDKNFRGKLESDAEKILAEVHSSIQRDLRKDSRWGVFLVKKIGIISDAEVQGGTR